MKKDALSPHLEPECRQRSRPPNEWSGDLSLELAIQLSRIPHKSRAMIDYWNCRTSSWSIRYLPSLLTLSRIQVNGMLSEGNEDVQSYEAVSDMLFKGSEDAQNVKQWWVCFRRKWGYSECEAVMGWNVKRNSDFYNFLYFPKDIKATFRDKRTYRDHETWLWSMLKLRLRSRKHRWIFSLSMSYAQRTNCEACLGLWYGPGNNEIYFLWWHQRTSPKPRSDSVQGSKGFTT